MALGVEGGGLGSGAGGDGLARLSLFEVDDVQGRRVADADVGTGSSGVDEDDVGLSRKRDAVQLATGVRVHPAQRRVVAGDEQHVSLAVEAKPVGTHRFEWEPADHGKVRGIERDDAGGILDVHVELASARVVDRPSGAARERHRGGCRSLQVDETSAVLARVVDLGGSAIAAVALPGRPRWAVHDACSGHFYVNVKDPAGVVALDAVDLATVGWLALEAIGPHGLGLDAERGVLLIACDDASLRWVDPSSGHELHAVALAGEPDVVFVDARRASAYVCVGDPPTLHVVDLDERGVREAITTGAGAKTAALDAERGRLYVFLPAAGQAWVYGL